jgi:hypothetical protein
LETRLAEAEAQGLPSLEHTVAVDPQRTLQTRLGGAQTIMTILPLKECLRMPGITDGRLFRKNVRQSLGANNKVNKALRSTINGERAEAEQYASVFGLGGANSLGDVKSSQGNDGFMACCRR